MTPATTPLQRSRPLTPAWPLVGLAVVLLLAAALRLVGLHAVGDGNAYYTAAVQSMLTSWHDFFFVSAEPGGSVSVDKPPLGLWIQAAFAAVLGVSGWSVTLPSVLAGVASVGVLYALVRRLLGVWPGLLAALVLAVSPVNVAVDRTNNLDSLLILFLLLAALAFARGADTGRRRLVVLGAVLVGLAFNVKMLQALLPLPAFYALYLLTAQRPLRRKLADLGLATLALAAVSLAWPVAVELTPASQRPYVGSSRSNSVFDLIVGYNGVARLVGGVTPGNLPGNAPGGMPDDAPNGRPGNVPPGLPGNASGGLTAPPANMPGFSLGERGAARLFTAPLGKEVGWLLPLALVGLMAAATVRQRSSRSVALLWGGWLVVGAVFFSAAGFFHEYYLATLAPAVAVGVAAFAWAASRSRPALGAALILGAGAATLLVQASLARAFTETSLSPVWWGALVAAVVVLAGIRVARLRVPGLILALGVLLAVPTAWAVKTGMSVGSAVLPSAWAGDGRNFSFGPMGAMTSGTMPSGGNDLAAYLSKTTRDTPYLVAVPSALVGSPLVLRTGRPVLLMGGFSGGDPVTSAERLAELVRLGEVRFVLGGAGGREAVTRWVESNCAVDEDAPRAGGGPPGLTAVLYDCRKP